jgi:hypothetical protein
MYASLKIVTFIIRNYEALVPQDVWYEYDFRSGIFIKGKTFLYYLCHTLGSKRKVLYDYV